MPDPDKPSPSSGFAPSGAIPTAVKPGDAPPPPSPTPGVNIPNVPPSSPSSAPTDAIPPSPTAGTFADPLSTATKVSNVPPTPAKDVSIGPAPVSPGPPTVSGTDAKLDPSGPLDPPHFLGGRADNTNPKPGYGHPASLVRPQDEHPTLEAQKFRVCHAGVGGFVKDEVITGLQIGSQVAIDRLTAAGAIVPAE